MAVRSLERGLVEHLANPPVGPIITLKLPISLWKLLNYYFANLQG